MPDAAGKLTSDDLAIINGWLSRTGHLAAGWRPLESLVAMSLMGPEKSVQLGTYYPCVALQSPTGELKFIHAIAMGLTFPP